MNDPIQNFIEHLRVTDDRTASELRRLMEGPETLLVATLLTDSLFGAMAVLCNYAYVVTGNGRTWPVLELDRVVCDAVCDEFKRLTGHDYKPTTLRTAEYRSLTQEEK